MTLVASTIYFLYFVEHKARLYNAKTRLSHYHLRQKLESVRPIGNTEAAVRS